MLHPPNPPGSWPIWEPLKYHYPFWVWREGTKSVDNVFLSQNGIVYPEVTYICVEVQACENDMCSF